MKTTTLILLSLICLSTRAQSSAKTVEMFLGVPVNMHYVTVKAGDTVELGSNAYITEIYMISKGDYIVFNGGEAFVYPDAGADHIVHRNEGVFEVDGMEKMKTFDREGNERFADEMIVSKNATFHLYYFTLAENEKPDLDINAALLTTAFISN
jgi:hypothetical protein